MKIKLDAKTISALALPKGKEEDFAWDAELEGFGLRLRRRTSGDLSRTFIAQYRADGHSRRPTIGDADKITVAQARDAARKLLARVTLGHDPQAEKRAKRERLALSFRAAAEAYLAATEPHLRPTSMRLNRLYLLGPYFRPLHATGVADVSHPHIAARLSAISRDHSSHTAAAARRALSAFYKWCTEEGWCGSNPVVGTRKPAENEPRDHVLSDRELAAIWRACSGDGPGWIIRLLILLGARRQEVGGMRWTEFDLDAGRWTLPSERSKNHRPHTVALPPAALAIINAVPRTSRDHLFGDRAGAGFTGWSGAKLELDRRLGQTVRPWRLHDIRRSVATGMADIGVEPHHIEACLSHYGGHRAGIAGVYNRSLYDRAAAAALARWADHVEHLVSGKKSDTVVKLRR